MRGSFNKTCDLWYGPLSVAGPPGALWAANVPCRLVPQLRIFQYEFPFTLAGHWVTLDAFEPNIPTTVSPGEWITADQWQQADRVSIPSGAPKGYFVCRKERIVPRVGAAYWRVMVIPLAALAIPPWLPPSPYPPVPPPPLVCALTSPNCMGANLAPAGLVCAYSSPIPDAQWFRAGTGSGAAVTLNMNQLGGMVFVNVTRGPNCGAAVMVYSGALVMGLNIPTFPGDFLFLEFMLMMPGSSYDWGWV